MANLIPLAGLGSRFDKEGYRLPKPLIPVSGKPMIIQVIKNMPKSEKWIFIVRKEHINRYAIDEIIKDKVPNAIIIPVENTTEGQACTCLLAEKYLDSEEELFIAPCDSTIVLDEKKFERAKKRKDVDAIFLTLTKTEKLRTYPNSWGWYKIEKDGETIKEISIKIPVSGDPFNDHAVTAFFYFKKAKDFIKSAKLMMEENYRVNNEFYVDSLPMFLKKLNKRAIIFDVELYISWNRPADLHEFEKIEFTVGNKLSEENLSDEEKELLTLWGKYFQNAKY